MKYINEVIVDLPMERTLELFDSIDNMYEWMEGLKSHKHLEGIPGEVGAKMAMQFKMGKQDFEIQETITAKDLPGIFSARYDSKFSSNHVSNSFIQIGHDKTKISSETEVFPHAFFVKLMCWIAPASFKKQSQKILDNFKKFAENQTN